MPTIGPFFYVRGKLIFSAVPLSEGRRQADKTDIYCVREIRRNRKM